MRSCIVLLGVYITYTAMCMSIVYKFHLNSKKGWAVMYRVRKSGMWGFAIYVLGIYENIGWLLACYCYVSSV